MESAEGVIVIEVSGSPGFKGIKKAAKLNVAREMMRQMITVARSRRRR